MSEKKPVRLTKEALQIIAKQFGVLAQPLRLQLLNELQFGERSVGELVTATGSNQANISKHLNLLANAQLLSRRKSGLNVYYAISDPIVMRLCDLMCSKLRADFEKKALTLKHPAGKRD
jgi:DNA-binding transcriptional ArsR family regulator